MKKTLTCIECPIGCEIEVEVENGVVLSVKGNTCPRGKVYAEAEVVCPKRVVTHPSPSHSSGSSQCTGPEHPVSCIKPGLVIYFTYGNITVSVLFSLIIPRPASATHSKNLLLISMSLLLSHI